MSTVSLRGTLVKRDLTSKETNLYPSSKSLCGRLLICETTSNVSLIENSLIVKGFSSLVRNLATGWSAVPVVSMIGRKGGRVSKDLCTFGRPCALAG